MTTPSAREVHAVTVVTNPSSGHGRADDAAVAAIARLTRRGAEVTEICAPTPAESQRQVRDSVTGALGVVPDVVVCVGGDGMVSTVLDALAETSVPLALVPGGTGNDLAREFGVVSGDPVAAVDVVFDGRLREIDLGVIEAAGIGCGGAMWFATVVCTGFDARVTLRANRMRWPRGPLRYSLAAVAELAVGAAIPYRIEMSHRTDLQPSIVDTEAVMVAVGNTRTYGGGMMICPDAVADDGLLDVTVVGAVSRRQMLQLLPALASGKRVEHPAVSQYRAEWLRLSAPGAPATADGEPAGVLPVTVRNVACGLSLLVP